MKQLISNLKYKCCNYKKIIKEFNNKKENIYSSSNNSDDEYYEREKRIKYEELPKLSSYNIINELKKLNRHQLKTIYNRYFSNKLSR